METLGVILLFLLAVLLANIVTAVAFFIISRTRYVPAWLRVLAGFLLVLDLPPMLIVFPGMFGPSRDEILGWGEGWRGLAITIFLLFLIPGIFLCWAVFKAHRPPHPPG
jgi:hypothetical protein